MRTPTQSIVAGAALTLIGAAHTAAQVPVGATSLSAAAVAESLAVIRTLDGALRADSRDAALWFRRGMVAWVLSDRGSAPNAPRELGDRNYARMADSSLRLATEYAPQNARYKLAHARFLLSTGNIAMRVVANLQFDNALELARKGPDSLLLSDAAIEAGRVHWRRFDALKHRSMRTGEIDMARSLSEALQPGGKAQGELTALAGGGDAAAMMYGGSPLGSLKNVQDLLRRATMPLPSDVNGAADYERANAYFREAYAAAPTNARAVRSVAMVLADSARWRELASFAQTQLTAFPWDPQGWLLLGLAEQRMGNSRRAASAFDSAHVYLAPSDRARIDRLERILRPSDSTRVSRAADAARVATANLYWRFADPLWSREGNESHVEFLARVVFAEVRWTVDELGIRGADTDRGDVYIRYGPPDIVTSIQPRATSEGQDVITYWLYRSGLIFTFSGMPTFGTARTPFADIGIAEATKDAQPVRWDNIASYTVDSMPLQVARFRGGRDSVDVLVATSAPYDSIVAASDVRAPVTRHFWMLRGGITAVHLDSGEVRSRAPAASVVRVAPGAYVYRTEVTMTGSLRAARVTGQVNADVDPRSGFSPRGFGISDILIASRTVDAPAGARWRALEPEVVTGPVQRRTQISLVWENYDFGAERGSARYTVALALTRNQSLAGRIAASIVGTLASVARVDRDGERVIIRFDRAVPHSAAIVDQVIVNLDETPAGSYTVMLEITDTITGRTTARTTTLLIRE